MTSAPFTYSPVASKPDASLTGGELCFCHTRADFFATRPFSISISLSCFPRFCSADGTGGVATSTKAHRASSLALPVPTNLCQAQASYRAAMGLTLPQKPFEVAL